MLTTVNFDLFLCQHKPQFKVQKSLMAKKKKNHLKPILTLKKIEEKGKFLKLEIRIHLSLSHTDKLQENCYL